MSAEDETAKMATEEFVAEYSEEHKIQPYSGTPKKDGVASAGDASSGFACGDHVHPTDTSRMAASATGADIAVSGTDNRKISAVLAGMADKATTYTKDEVDAKIVGFVDGAEYDSVAKKILLKHGTTTVSEIDATDFIKDGMVSSVEIEDGNLVITFNTDAGQGPITIPLTDIFDPDNYYDKDAVDNLLDDKQDTLTFDSAPTSGSNNHVKSGGIWSAIWGTASTAFSSLYDWCVAQLAGKLDKSGGTMTGNLTVHKEDGPWAEIKAETAQNSIAIRQRGGVSTLETDDDTYVIPRGGGTFAMTADILAKLDSTSAAPAFSSDSSTQYAVGSHVTYNGKLYVCTTATTGGTWDASKWTADTMTDPDAVLDITSQNQLRVVAKDGTLLWAQGYDLASTSSATLACDATNNFTFADGATTQAFTLPTAPTGKVGDFGLDIDNSANKSDATISFTNITNNTASVVIPKGENLNDMLAIAAGELARFYITLSTFRVNNLPTWHIVKQVVENGGAQS